jgi:hypothetical protein
MCPGTPQKDAGEVSTTTTAKDPTMLSPHIVSALLAQREADLRQRAELARLRQPEPGPEPGPEPEPEPAAAAAGSRRTSRHHGRRRHLRLV